MTRSLFHKNETCWIFNMTILGKKMSQIQENFIKQTKLDKTNKNTFTGFSFTLFFLTLLPIVFFPVIESLEWGENKMKNIMSEQRNICCHLSLNENFIVQTFFRKSNFLILTLIKPMTWRSNEFIPIHTC